MAAPFFPLQNKNPKKVKKKENGNEKNYVNLQRS